MPRKTGEDKAVDGARRPRGLAAAADPVRGPVTRTVERFGFADPQVLTRWREIVGEDLAPRCRPVKVLHGRGKDLAARLLVAADGAAALEIEYRAEQIVERVNAVYGYRHISRLSISQANAGLRGFAEAVPGEGADARHRGEPSAALTTTSAAATAAERAAAPVQDERLRAALGRLGAYVLSHPRDDDAGTPTAAGAEKSRETEGQASTPPH